MKHRVSLGTRLFLVLTLIVVLMTLVFLLSISGTDISDRAEKIATNLDSGVRGGGQEEMDENLLQLANEGDAETTADETVERPLVKVPQNNEKSTVRISVAGDLTVSKSIRESCMMDDQEYDFDGILNGVEDIFLQSDLSIATLETMTAETKKLDTYNAPASILDAARNSGINFFNLATEHVLDQGYEGLQITRAELTTRGINYCGIYEKETLNQPPMLIIHGISIALLGYTYGFSDDSMAASSEDERGQIPVLTVEKVIHDITTARASGANIVIVMPHWGTKNRDEVSDEMRDIARQLALAGADMILGAHSNVVSEMEIMNVQRADGRFYKTLVCYSLGALLMDARSEENAAGMILTVEMEYDAQNRKADFLLKKVTPTYIYQNVENDVTVWHVMDASDPQQMEGLPDDIRDSALQAAERIQNLSFQ